MPSASTKHLPAGDAIIGAEAQPRRKVVFVLPVRHIQADFTHHGLCDADVDPINPRQVNPADAVELVP
jgi:hypothetical protein